MSLSKIANPAGAGWAALIMGSGVSRHNAGKRLPAGANTAKLDLRASHGLLSSTTPAV